MTSNILQCKICGGEIKVWGKRGAYLQTECMSCGATSDNMISTYLDIQEKRIEEIKDQRIR